MDWGNLRQPPSSSKHNSSNYSKTTVCSEEEYVDILNKVIVDSYFPDLPKLRRKLASLEEREQPTTTPRETRGQTGDWLTQSVPSTWGTPQSVNSNYRTVDDKTEKVSKGNNRPLENFFRKYTSEDNYSFEVLVRQEEKEKTRKNLLLSEQLVLDKAILHDGTQLVPYGKTGELTALGDARPKRLHFWPFREKNYLFFCPTEAPLTEKELQLRKFVEERKEIRRDNTRFKSLPYVLADSFRIKSGSDAQSESSVVDLKQEEIRILKRLGQRHGTSSSATSSEIGKYERLEDDSKLDTIDEWNVFVPSSPVLSPRNIPNSPFITWGQVAATPQLLQDEEEDIQDEWLSNATTSQKEQHLEKSHANFHIPKMDSREEAALHLERKLTGKKRKSHDRRHPSTPISGATSFSRSVALSPAAKRLADSLKIPSMHSVRRTPFTSYRKSE
jgi:protein DGCR14